MSKTGEQEVLMGFFTGVTDRWSAGRDLAVSSTRFPWPRARGAGPVRASSARMPAARPDSRKQLFYAIAIFGGVGGRTGR
jgi:hypothetical protein